MLDRFDCYELTVQSPRHVVALLRGVHGAEPLVLREDFCGTAAVSRRWASEGAKRGDRSRAVAVDVDDEVVWKAAKLAREDGVGDRVAVVKADVLEGLGKPEEGSDASDVVFVGNFSIGYIHERAMLLAYLDRARRRLVSGNAGWGGGIFVCDTYGGNAFRLGGFTRKHPGRGREMIHYTWVRERADPITAMVENSISFRVEIDGEVVAEMPTAFVYRWRLWSIAELREAMLEVGFTLVAVHQDTNIAPGQRPTPVSDPRELGEDWIVLVAARA